MRDYDRDSDFEAGTDQFRQRTVQGYRRRVDDTEQPIVNLDVERIVCLHPATPKTKNAL